MLDPSEIKFYLSVFKELSVTDIAGLFSSARTRKLAAFETYIDQGSTTKRFAHIKKGLIRGYHIKPNGDDVTIMLRWENQIIASHDSIIMNRPSRFIYQALEDTVLIELDYDKAEAILNNSPKLSSHRNSLLLHMLAEALERVESFVLLNPEERYLALIREKPDIYNRVPSKYLATLLGITPVSLSRIRKRLAKAGHH